jgi:outer membrane murein-binding lipoprotein Lpp
MKRGVTFSLALLVSTALLVAGCSKDQTKQLQTQVSQLQTQVQGLEAQQQAAKTDADKAALAAADEKRRLEDQAAALEARLMHQPLDAWTINPAAVPENGWLLLDGDRTYTLKGYPEARAVRFYFEAYGQNKAPVLLGQDTSGQDGWSWTGPLPAANLKTVWAEIEYAGGVKVTSPVLPIRSAGK